MRLSPVLRAALLALLLTPGAAPALAAPGTPALDRPPSPAPHQPVASEGRAGDLQILQLWTPDPAAFLREWAEPTPPRLPTASRTARNLPIEQFIIFSSCKADAAGNCRLTARIEIADPDGAPYGDPMAFTIWDDKPAPPPARMILSPNSIGLVVEDGEKLGTYRIHLAVTDVHAGVTAESLSAIEVTEAEKPATSN
jgi:hypothetical protein